MEAKQYLYNYALKLLGGRRYTIAEMQKKLAARVSKIQGATTTPGEGPAIGDGASPGAEDDIADSAPAPVSPDEISAIIDRLIRYKFLDDREYAALYIRDHLLRKPQGIMMLRLKMNARGLPKDIIAQALRDADINEAALAGKSATKKLKTLRGSAGGKIPPRKQKEKLARFLISRGFGSRAVGETLKAFPSDGEEDYQSP